MDKITNDQLLTFFQLIIALSVIRVWTMNFSKPSRWRGGGAKNMKEEFIAYGLPSWIMYLVGSLKVGFSIGFPFGFPIEFPAINDYGHYWLQDKNSNFKRIN